jgi:hypothetical protein
VQCASSSLVEWQGRTGFKGIGAAGLLIQQVELPNGMKVHEHVYDLAAGSIVHDLWTLLNSTFQDDCVPVAWGACFVSAVLTEVWSPRSCLDNYRGIAVGSVFGKLLCSCVCHCLSPWCRLFLYIAVRCGVPLC